MWAYGGGGQARSILPKRPLRSLIINAETSSSSKSNCQCARAMLPILRVDDLKNETPIPDLKKSAYLLRLFRERWDNTSLVALGLAEELDWKNMTKFYTGKARREPRSVHFHSHYERDCIFWSHAQSQGGTCRTLAEPLEKLPQKQTCRYMYRYFSTT